MDRKKEIALRWANKLLDVLGPAIERGRLLEAHLAFLAALRYAMEEYESDGEGLCTTKS